MPLVRIRDIEKVDPDHGGYMVTHTDGSRCHVPHNPDNPDFHSVQDWLKGYFRTVEGAARATAVAPAEPRGEVTVLPPRVGRVRSFLRKIIGALLLTMVCAGAAQADSLVVATCGTLPQAYSPGATRLDTVDINGNLCANVSVTATANTTVAAQSTLPTLSPGTQTPTASLAGAAYVQPVFGSATGGGTQVDLTHGLPVNVVAGGGAGGTSSSFGAAFPATGTAAGFTDGTNMQPGKVDGSGNQLVNLQTAIPAGGNNIGSVNVANSPTVTANQGTANTAANAWPHKITDGTNTAAVKAASTAPAATDPALVVAISPNTPAIATTPPSNASTNVTQFGGSAVVTGTGAGGAGIPRVTVSNDSTVTANQGTANATPWNDNVAQIAGTAPAMKASGTNAATTDTSLVVAPSPNPSTVCGSVKPINQTASTDLVTSTNKLHICSIVLISATAQNLSLVEGTGSVCATGIAALIGGTTASLAVAANGGFSAVSERAWLETQTTADHLCLLQSGAGNVSGTITYTDHN